MWIKLNKGVVTVVMQSANESIPKAKPKRMCCGGIKTPDKQLEYEIGHLGC